MHNIRELKKVTEWRLFIKQKLIISINSLVFKTINMYAHLFIIKLEVYKQTCNINHALNFTQLCRNGIVCNRESHGIPWYNGTGRDRGIYIQ